MKKKFSVRRFGACTAGLLALSLLAACGGDEGSDEPKQVDGY